MDFVNTKLSREHYLLSPTVVQVPNFVVNILICQLTLGHLIYFFEIAVGLSGYLNSVNPFDQPG